MKISIREIDRSRDDWPSEDCTQNEYISHPAKYVFSIYFDLKTKEIKHVHKYLRSSVPYFICYVSTKGLGANEVSYFALGDSAEEVTTPEILDLVWRNIILEEPEFFGELVYEED